MNILILLLAVGCILVLLAVLLAVGLSSDHNQNDNSTGYFDSYGWHSGKTGETHKTNSIR